MLSRLFKAAPKLGRIEAQLLLRQAYETEHGLFNHLAQGDPSLPLEQRRPLAVVAQLPGEDESATSLLRAARRRYAEARVGHYYYLSLNEFLALPRQDCEDILLHCDELAKADAQRAQAIQREVSQGDADK